MRSEVERQSLRRRGDPPRSFLSVPGLGLGLYLAFAAAAPSAHAGLGGGFDSVEADRAHMAASIRSSGAGAFTIHTLTLANHGSVREYTRADGTVFAVAWSGPGRPDLRQLLGEHFATFQADNVSPSGRRTRRPLTVNRSELVVQSAGHPGAFRGFAFLPQMAPSGFSTAELK